MSFYNILQFQLFHLISISRNCKHGHNNVLPGDLHADSDHGGLLPLLDPDPHLQHLGCFRAPWIWQLRQNILRLKIFQPPNLFIVTQAQAGPNTLKPLLVSCPTSTGWFNF